MMGDDDNDVNVVPGLTILAASGPCIISHCRLDWSV